MTAVHILRQAYQARQAEAARRGVDPGNAWALREMRAKLAAAKQRIATARPAIAPSSATTLLAVCRQPCPDYRRDGAAEYCERDRAAVGCEAAARRQWTARALGHMPPCERQTQVGTRDIPASGMVSPASQQRIQIEITNFCGGHVHAGNCSNCSRFCPHVATPFFMDAQTFRRAVDSMAGYAGMVGIMGGEPTLHPQFATLVRYYQERWEGFRAQTKGRSPIRDFAAYHASQLAATAGQRCGLWTAMGPGYRKHYELIQDTFGYQCINTHENQARHQALLVTRRELGIGDAEWIRLRNNCWVQREWSAAINPRGAWFCEIAAALAMLYGDLPDCPGPREGWPVEPGWWRRTPEEFGEQLRWCEVCAAPLNVPARRATEYVQDVSPWHLDRLRAVRSPAIAAGRFQVFGLGTSGLDSKTQDPRPKPKDPNWYMPPADEPRRAAGRDAELRPRRIDGLVVSVDCGDQLAKTLPANVGHFDRLIVVTAPRDERSQQVARDCGAEIVLADPHHGDSAFNKGHMLNAGLTRLAEADWVLLHDADVFLPPTLGELRQLILNPGCLYYTKRHHLPSHVTEPDWALVTDYELLDPQGNNNPWGYFQLFNIRASSISRPFRFPECFCSAGTIDHWTQAQWPKDKQISLADWAGDHRFDALHLWHGPLASRWNGYAEAGGRWRYAGQTNLGQSEEHWARQWPVPCRVRRINATTLDIEEIEWRGGRLPQWGSPQDRAAVYEYSVRPLA